MYVAKDIAIENLYKLYHFLILNHLKLKISKNTKIPRKTKTIYLAKVE